MSILETILAPVSLQELRETYFGRQCLLIKRTKTHPFRDLLTVEQLDARLNDGVATLAGLNIILPTGNKIDPNEIVSRPKPAVWSPQYVRKSKVRDYLEQGSSFVLHNMSAISPAVEALIRDIEETFSAHADVHVYVSPRAGATGYNAHKDEPQHKLYLQLHGSTDWVVYKGTDKRIAMPPDEAERLLGVDFRATLTPGSVLYMPPGVFHYATNPHSPRISLSIPFIVGTGAEAVDRTRIPLVDYFSAGLSSK